jgi:hypothetical protein
MLAMERGGVKRMRIANEVKHAVHRVEVTIEQARAKLASFFSRDPELRRVIASEFPVQRRANDLKQRNAEKFWKMQYAGRPGRDPQFRVKERLIFQKIYEDGLNREEVAKELYSAVETLSHEIRRGASRSTGDRSAAAEDCDHVPRSGGTKYSNTGGIP